MEEKTAAPHTEGAAMLRLMRLATAFLGLILAAVLVLGVMSVIRLNTVKGELGEIKSQLSRMDIEALTDAIDDLGSVNLSDALPTGQLPQTILSFKDAADKLNQLDMEAVNEALDAFTGAADILGKVDADKLNETVAALKDAADALSGLDMTELNSTVEALHGTAGKLSGVDIEKLNEMISSLTAVSDKLDRLCTKLGIGKNG